MKKDELEVMKSKINHLQDTLEEYRLYADFSLAVQMILHNIRNSITGAIGSAEINERMVDGLLQKIELDTLTTEELQDGLNQIKIFSQLSTKSIRKVEVLTQEILLKGKADNSCKIEPFDLNALIKNEINFMKYTSPFVNAKITIDTDLTADPIYISARKHDIVQVFENLAHNAIESMNGEGKVQISTFCEQGFAYFSISDTGSGIEKEHLSEIFEPFFTTKKSTDKLTFFGGTGLGLHSCKKLVDSYKGSITIKGDLNPGSQFTVKLPTL